jgi:hypothetical protein
MTNDENTDTPRSTATVEAVQAVVDRVSSYQESAPEGTVETELRSGLDEAGVQLTDRDVTRLAEAIENAAGAGDPVRVPDVLS